MVIAAQLCEYTKNDWIVHLNGKVVYVKYISIKLLQNNTTAQNLRTGRWGHMWKDFASDVWSITTDHLHYIEYWNKNKWSL